MYLDNLCLNLESNGFTRTTHWIITIQSFKKTSHNVDNLVKKKKINQIRIHIYKMV